MSEIQIADLKILRTVDDDTPEVGQEITWKIEVRNEGPDTADNVLVSDLIPEGVTLTSEATSGGSFSQPNDTWSIGQIASGGVEVLTLTTVVDSANPIAIASTVSTDSHDCDPENNTHHVTVVPWKPSYSDLSLNKTVNNDSPVIGSNVAWTLTVTNNGPNTAWNTVINDDLPDGLSYISSTDDAYDADNGVWNVGNLKSGGTAEIQIITSVDSHDGSNFVNRAVASTNSIDSNPDNDAAEASIEPVAPSEPPPPSKPSEGKPPGGKPGEDKPGTDKPDHDKPHGGKPHHDDHHHHESQTDCYQCGCLCSTEKEPTSGADLQISKFVSNPTPDYGGEVVWTIVVENNGPEDAENVVVNDSLPGGLEHVADNATMGEFDEALGIWSIGDLANGSSAVLQITTVATNAEFAQVNIAIVGSDTEDSDPSNNIDHASIDAVGVDLVIEKTVNEPAPDLGDLVTWTIKVSNNGPDTAENVMVEDTLPDGVTFRSASSEEFVDSTGIWTIGDLASGASASIDIEVTVDDADGPRENVATVSSETAEIDPDNNTAQAETDAVAADLEITKTVSNPSPSLEDEVSWTITVENYGPDSAINVVVADTLPSGVELVTAKPGVGDFDAATGEWTFAALDSGEKVSLELVTTVSSLAEQENIASVTSVTYDNNPNNNQDSDILDAAQVDISLSKNAVGVTTVSAGDNITWELVAKNDGPDDATGVTVEDILPDGLALLSPSTDAYSDGIWNIGDLPAGEETILTIETTVEESATPGDLLNVAQVATQDQGDIDSVPGNDDGDQSEDDEDSALVTIEAGLLANPNSLLVEGSGGASINAVVVIDRSSSMSKEITIDGETKTRLEWNIEAVAEFAERPEIQSLKIIAFDGRVTDGETIYDGGDADLSDKNYVPLTEVSQWINLTGPTNAELNAFLESLAPSTESKPWGSGTNYQAAIDATMNQSDQPVTLAEETNYYFFSDGVPTAGGSEDNTLSNENAWQQYVEDSFDNAYAVGFGGAIEARDALEQVAHINGSPDNPEIDDDPNLVLVNDVEGIPSLLNNFASTSVSGNAIADDLSQGDITIKEMVFDEVTYTYSDASISETGTTQGAFLTNSFVVVDSKQGGSLQFDFETGDFTYFAPTTDTLLTELFEYTIVDEDGKTDSSTVTINVTASPNNSASSENFLVSSDIISSTNDELDQVLPGSAVPLNPEPMSEEEAAAALLNFAAESVPAIDDPQLALLLDQSLVI